MSTMSPEQKKVQAKSRREWIKRLDYLVSCTKLSHDDPEYIHPSDLVEDILYEIPDYDITKGNRNKYLKMCGVDVDE